MASASRVFLGSALLVVGFGVLAGPAAYRNAFVQTALGAIDFKDRQCRRALVGMGSACPSGCAARPLAGPEDRDALPECRSRLWVGTCGKACEPRAGLVRLPDGGFASSGRLIVELKGPSDAASDDAIAALGATFEATFAGLNRYEASFDNAEDDLERLTRMRARIEALPQVLRVEYELK